MRAARRPDCNPVEMAFSTLNANVRKARRANHRGLERSRRGRAQSIPSARMRTFVVRAGYDL
jgi:hypothetical protein